MKKTYSTILCLMTFVPAFMALLLFSNCDLELPSEGYHADGIVIYAGREILNNRVDVPIVAKRLLWLNAVTPCGGVVYWESSSVPTMEIDKYSGYLQVGQALGQRAIITAYLKDNPKIRAQVQFLVFDLR
jgi:hypothetical protein